MKQRKEWLRQLNNLQLSTKIISILLIVVLLTVASSLFGIYFTQNASQKLLFQALAGSLSYSARDISRKLSNIESMTSSIVSNSDIKKNLITLVEDDAEIRVQNAESTLNNLLFDYYQTYKANNIQYINFYYNSGVVSSYEAGSSSVPDQIHQNIIAKANENSGYPYWDTAYCNSYGLFLGRDCRRVDKMNYSTLGTLVVCIDMADLIKTSTSSVLHYEETKYILYDDTHSFYQSPGINEDQAVQINKQVQTDYSEISIEDDKYFAVRGSIQNGSWNYICLVPYNSIADTINVATILAFTIILAAVCVALFFSRFLIASIAKDFRCLVDKMKAFAADEAVHPDAAYDYRLRTDEIGVLHNQFDMMVIKIQQLIQQNYVNEILAKDARLKALENQINPHFLYNTLESVNWRAKAIGERDISKMVESLGALLRETLDAKEDDFTVRKELKIVESYLTIQQIRFEDRLCYSQDVDDSVMDIKLPHFSIQPLVENAIQYSMEELTETCYIRIEGKCIQNMVYINIKNNGSQFESDLLRKLEKGQVVPRGFGIGLTNIHKRIQLTYGDEYGLSFYNEGEEYAVVRINIPGGGIC